MAQLFETLCMMLAFKESHSLAMHYCRLVWDVRSLRYLLKRFIKIRNLFCIEVTSPICYETIHFEDKRVYKISPPLKLQGMSLFYDISASDIMRKSDGTLNLT